MKLKSRPKGFYIWFISIWFLILVSFFTFLYGLGLVPSEILALGGEVYDGQNSTEVTPAQIHGRSVEYPRILIGAIGLDSEIIFPQSDDLDTLNQNLLKGVVHFPSSAFPGKEGNMLIFGHSTAKLPARNKNYAIFNRIKELKQGEIITIQEGDREYYYKVSSVALRRASETEINLSSQKPMLTLSTCNVLGRKEERYIVEAEFVGSSPIANLSFLGESREESSS